MVRSNPLPQVNWLSSVTKESLSNKRGTRFEEPNWGPGEKAEGLAAAERMGGATDFCTLLGWPVFPRIFRSAASMVWQTKSRTSGLPPVLARTV